MKYSGQQIEKAMIKYYQQLHQNPDKFEDYNTDYKTQGKDASIHLLSLVD